jgi:hypothetical protein
MRSMSTVPDTPRWDRRANHDRTVQPELERFLAKRMNASTHAVDSSRRGRRIFGVHIYDEMGVGGEESHLTVRVATISAMCDKLPDGETRAAR